jgi:hypothetical protein
MILHCEATDLKMPVVTADATAAAEELRSMVERHLPLDNPPSRRRLVVRLLGLILDQHTVEVPACGWSGVIDDIAAENWAYTTRSRIAWQCPRCGAQHEEDLRP